MNNIALSSALQSTNNNGNISWPKASSKKQHFSLLHTIIYYIAKNPPTPEVYLKLLKSCKYFFEKNPIIVVDRIHDGGRKFCQNYAGICYEKNGKCCIQVDIRKIISKIWLTDELDIRKNAITYLSTILFPKLYRCENADLYFKSREITLEEYKLWVTKFQKICLINVKIINGNKSAVMFDEILGAIPNVQYFEYEFNRDTPAVTTPTIKNIIKLKNLSNLKYFTLHEIPELFDIQDLGDFIKSHRGTKIRFDFQRNISVEYGIQLNQLLDIVIDAGIQYCVIKFCGQNENKFQIMANRFFDITKVTPKFDEN